MEAAHRSWKHRAHGLWSLFVETFEEWNRDNASMLGAALAYYSLFSLGPLILIVLALVAPIFGEEQVKAELLARMGAMMGSSQVDTVRLVMDKAGRLQGGSWAAALGVVTLAASGSAVLLQLRTAMNLIWNVEPEKDLPWYVTVFRYVRAIVGIVLIAGVLLLSLILTTAISAMDKYFFQYLPASAFTLQTMNFLGLVVVETSLFTLLFKWFPDTEVRWKEVLLGAAVTTVLFEIGKSAISLYLSHQGFESTFGAAGAIVAVMFWIYYSSQIVFFGAEFTQVHAKRQREREGLPTKPQMAHA